MALHRYDGLGRWARHETGSAGSTEYLYEGDHLLLERSPTGAITEYTYYPGIDHPHSMRQWAGGASGATYYYVTELPGHVAGLLDSSDNLVNQYRYRPFGKLDYQSEGTLNPLRFQGREIDGTTELYYFRNRWYDPELARFLSEDPIGLEGGINPYAFAGNNPVNLTDPDGLKGNCYHIGQENSPEVREKYEAGKIGACALLPGLGSSGAAWPFRTPWWQGWTAHPTARGAWGATGSGEGTGGSERSGGSLGLTPGGGWGGAGPYALTVDPDELFQNPITDVVLGAVVVRGAGRFLSPWGPIFRPGGLLNNNRHLRIGVGRHQGRAVFRISGNWVQRFRQNPHIDVRDLGPWRKP